MLRSIKCQTFEGALPGARINYNEPRVIQFFEQNVVHLLEE
jgi:hypothetical protein